MRAAGVASASERGRVLDRQLMLRLWPFLKPYSGSFALSMALLPVLTVADLAKPFLLKQAIDQHLVPGRTEGLWGLAGVYVGVLVAHSALTFAHAYLNQRAGQRALADLRREVFACYQRLDMGFLNDHPVGALMTRATTDVEALSQMFQSGLVAMVADLVTMAGILAVMLWLAPGLTMAMLLVLPPVWLLTDFIQKRMRGCFGRARAKLAQMNAFVQENIGGIRLVHLFDLEDRHCQRFAELNAGYRDAYHESNWYDSSLFSTMEFTGHLCVAVFLWVGATQLEAGVVTIGTLVAFFEYMGRFFQPLRDLSSKFAVMQGAMAAAEKIVHVLDTRPAITSPADPTPLPDAPRGGVVFQGVTFGYRPDQPVLEEVDLVIMPGEKVAVVGPTGAGKTTLIKLLERFYDPQEGRVLLDGVDLRDADLEALRGDLAVVLQDVFLVAGTVEENVALGDEDVSSEAVRAACEAVEVAPFVEALPQGYQTMVEEGGSNFSSGERQLLSFARALVRDPRVLILDEATSNVDVETEARLKRAVDTLLEGRTAIVIAHRLSTIRACDRVLVMHKGRLIEQGTHDQLVAAGGMYAKLYQLQEKDRMAAAG